MHYASTYRGVYECVALHLRVFCISALHGSELSASGSGRLILRKRVQILKTLMSAGTGFGQQPFFRMRMKKMKYRLSNISVPLPCLLHYYLRRNL